jgi:hypothetical protein
MKPPEGAGTTWNVMWLTDKSVDGTVWQVQNCYFCQTSSVIKCGICLVLSGYRVWTHTLCGPNRPGTGPNITASALNGSAPTSKFAR